MNFRRGWNAALDIVWQGLADVQDQSLTLEQEALKDGLFDFINNLSFDDDLLKPQPTNADLAEKYAISQRTVTNWRKADCPFADGQPQVLNWAMEQRLLPRQFKVKFARQLQKRHEKVQESDAVHTIEESAKQLYRLVRTAKIAGVL